MNALSHIPQALRPDFKKAETQALWIAVAIHLLIFVIYSFNYASMGESVVVSKLKIRLGEGNINSPGIVFAPEAPEPQYMITDETSAATEAVVESPVPIPEGAVPEDAVPLRKARQVYFAPEILAGSSYGNSGDGQLKAENYLQLLGYLVQERAVVETPASLKGSAVLNLHINREGYVVSYRLKKGSGHTALDNAAINFARNAMKEPLPPPPKSFDPKAKILKYDFTIYYD